MWMLIKKNLHIKNWGDNQIKLNLSSRNYLIFKFHVSEFRNLLVALQGYKWFSSAIELLILDMYFDW